jgi:hypothetical protein
MPLSLWTNTVFWLTADSPVYNAGATNAEWICYAKTCAGNATQTVLNSQPSRVFTNGLWALSFDGTDDFLRCFYPVNITSLYVRAELKIDKSKSAHAVFANTRSASFGGLGLAFYISGANSTPAARLQGTTTDGAFDRSFSINIPDSYFLLEWEWLNGVASVWLNGESQMQTGSSGLTNITGIVSNNTTRFAVGKDLGVGDNILKGDVRSIFISTGGR